MAEVIVVRPHTALWDRLSAVRPPKGSWRRVRMPVPLAREMGLDPRRGGLARIATRYIGETEKNLAKTLRDVQRDRWVLLFDEADAIFGKRTNVKDSHDRYANQEVSHLVDAAELAATRRGRRPSSARRRQAERTV